MLNPILSKCQTFLSKPNQKFNNSKPKMFSHGASKTLKNLVGCQVPWNFFDEIMTWTRWFLEKWMKNEVLETFEVMMRSAQIGQVVWKNMRWIDCFPSHIIMDELTHSPINFFTQWLSGHWDNQRRWIFINIKMIRKLETITEDVVVEALGKVEIYVVN